MSDDRIGVYPGTFDPITKGHLDIIRRAASTVDALVIAIAENRDKGPLFSVEERLHLVQDEINNLKDKTLCKRIQVMSFNNLLIDFVASVGARQIFRGLRAVSDFDYEFQMAGMNHRLNANVDTLFLMASERYQFISSRFVKEVCRLGGDVSQFVSPLVEQHLKQRFATPQA